MLSILWEEIRNIQIRMTGKGKDYIFCIAMYIRHKTEDFLKSEVECFDHWRISKNTNKNEVKKWISIFRF